MLPPIARLTPDQAMYHFLSGYTAKVAGTEIGVTEPTRPSRPASARAFMPRHPSVYGNLLKKRIAEGGAECWLVNTGWTGGKYGVGKRMPIKETRALLNAALDGSLKNVEFRKDPNFGFEVPVAVPGVDSVDPRSAQHLGGQGRIRPHGRQAGRPVRREFRRVRGASRRGRATSRRPKVRRRRANCPVITDRAPNSRTRSDDRLFATPFHVRRRDRRISAKACSHALLPREEWTHEAHLAATTYLILRRPDIDLDAELPGIIRRYNESVGGVNSDTEGYHETITRAFLRGVRLFLAEADTERAAARAGQRAAAVADGPPRLAAALVQPRALVLGRSAPHIRRA